MSIRDRLQGLVELLENKEKPEEELVDEIEKIEELLASEDEIDETEEAKEVEIPESVEIQHEELETLNACRQEMDSAQLLFGQLTMNYEFQKVKMLKKYTEAQKALQNEVERLRGTKGIPEDIAYTFILPENDGDSGFFKKEE